MRACDGFGDVERGRAVGHVVRRERGARCVRNWLLHERVWQGFEARVVFKREMRAFVRFDENQNARRIVGRAFSGRAVRGRALRVIS